MIRAKIPNPKQTITRKLANSNHFQFLPSQLLRCTGICPTTFPCRIGLFAAMYSSSKTGRKCLPGAARTNCGLQDQTSDQKLGFYWDNAKKPGEKVHFFFVPSAGGPAFPDCQGLTVWKQRPKSVGFVSDWIYTRSRKGVAAQLMRRILVDYSRGHDAKKRSGGVEKDIPGRSGRRCQRKGGGRDCFGRTANPAGHVRSSASPSGGVALFRWPKR